MNYTFTLRKLLFFLIVFTFVSTQVQGQTRPKYRTFDGTLNNLSYPQFGKSGIVLRADVFNVFNAVNLSGYSNNATQSNQVQVGPASSGLLVRRNAAPPRQFQFGLRYSF